MKALNRMHVLRGAFAGLLLAGAVGSCGKAAEEEDLQIDSNTNWLMRCDADSQCSGSLRCYCGQCSQPCSESSECRLLAGAECASSGGAACEEQPSAGGLCVLGCIQDAECGPDFTCTQNQCVPRPCANGYQSWDGLYALIANDLAQLDADDATFARYVSVANRWTHAACGPVLSAEREGLSKLVNSLSRSPVVTSPAPIDADLTLYRIDLRDYDWDDPVELRGTAYTDVWEALVANNPFAVPFVGDDADDAVADSGARVPVMFANSLIATTTDPNVYYAVLGLADNHAALLANLGVDAAAPGVRAGYVGRPEIIATYRPLGIRSGYLWELAAVDDPERALFADPLQTPEGERQLIFSLPNGLQAFAYTAGTGRRIDESPTFLDLVENDFRARVPRTPLRQHSPKPNVHDQMRDYLTNNPDLFSPVVEASIVGLYRDEASIRALIDSDYESFTRPALMRAGVDLSRPEPLTTAFNDYDRDLTIDDAAGEFLLTREDLEDNLNLLEPPLGVLDGGLLDRDDFALLFRQALCTLSAVQENAPAPEWCL